MNVMITSLQIENDNKQIADFLFFCQSGLSKEEIIRRKAKDGTKKLCCERKTIVRSYIPAFSCGQLCVCYFSPVPNLTLKRNPACRVIRQNATRSHALAMQRFYHQRFKKNSCVHLPYFADWSRTKAPPPSPIMAISNQDLRRAIYNYQIRLH